MIPPPTLFISLKGICSNTVGSGQSHKTGGISYDYYLRDSNFMSVHTEPLAIPQLQFRFSYCAVVPLAILHLPLCSGN